MSKKMAQGGEITGKERVLRREICLANWFYANEAEPVKWKRRSMRWLSMPEASLAVANSQRWAILSPHEIQIWVFIYRCMILHFAATCTFKLTRVVGTNNPLPSQYNFQKKKSVEPRFIPFCAVLVWFHVIYFSLIATQLSVIFACSITAEAFIFEAVWILFFTETHKIWAQVFRIWFCRSQFQPVV